MNIERISRFEKAFKKLPGEIQQKALEQIKRLLENPSHPSLRLKKIKKTTNVWEMSVTMNYRITLNILTDRYRLRNIGPHKIIKKA
jgi:mRNA-degrading endonuclease RelE of RelBE toxin-antitoxin system